MTNPVEKVPAPVSDQERWIANNRVFRVEVQREFYDNDKSRTYVILTSLDGDSVRWLDSTFNKIADLRLDYIGLVEPKYGIRERVQAREAFEKKNAAELAEYERLRKKFGE